jgi:tetratricopeptide (TPR) repeat protein
LTLLALSGCTTVGDRQAHEGLSANPRYQQARSLMEKGGYARAVPILQELADANPDRADVAVNLAIASRKSGRLDGALNILQGILETHPDDAVALNQLGIVQRQLGHFDAAVAAYQHAIGVDDGYALAHRNLGILYDIYLQKLDSALKQYEKYLTLAAGGDQEVDNWVIDLKHRIKNERKEDRP